MIKVVHQLSMGSFANIKSNTWDHWANTYSSISTKYVYEDKCFYNVKFWV